MLGPSEKPDIPKLKEKKSAVTQIVLALCLEQAGGLKKEIKRYKSKTELCGNKML